MAKLYSKERSKYGSGSGTIITWTVEIQNVDPNAEENLKNLPAGYLKCDGGKYSALLYPVLAEILGTGESSKFIRYDISGEPLDFPSSTEFVVPDLGSKFIKPTSGGAAGSYGNINTRNQLGVAKFRSGMGIVASSSVGVTTGNATVIPLAYSGLFVIPSQTIAIRGKPSWSVGTNNSGVTDEESLDSSQVHSHLHFSTTNRLRIKTTNEMTGDARPFGQGFRRTASTIPIQLWMDNTTYDNNPDNLPGTNQQPCWAIASGALAAQLPSSLLLNSGPFGVSQTVYHNVCNNFRTTATSSPGLTTLRYYCLLNVATVFDLGVVTHFVGPSRLFTNITNILGVDVCIRSSEDEGTRTLPGQVTTVPATYTNGALGVPLDYNNGSLFDVVPMNSNSSTRTQQVSPEVNNTVSEVLELSQPAGNPTKHNHKIDLVKGDHSYAIRTNAKLLAPDNLKTTLTLRTNQVASLDQVTGPYIILEYLIKY